MPTTRQTGLSCVRTWDSLNTALETRVCMSSPTWGCVLSSGGKGRSDAERPVHNPDRDIAKLTAVTDGSS